MPRYLPVVRYRNAFPQFMGGHKAEYFNARMELIRHVGPHEMLQELFAVLPMFTCHSELPPNTTTGMLDNVIVSTRCCPFLQAQGRYARYNCTFFARRLDNIVTYNGTLWPRVVHLSVPDEKRHRHIARLPACRQLQEDMLLYGKKVTEYIPPSEYNVPDVKAAVSAAFKKFLEQQAAKEAESR